MYKALIPIFILFTLLSCAKKDQYPIVAQSDGKIKIDTSDLKEGLPKFLSYKGKNKTINFIIIKTGRKVSSYFDTCLKCYPKKRGYKYDDGWLLCKSCGIRYPIESLDGIGSCYPIPFEGQLEGNLYIIKLETLLSGSKYF
jgi:uncharacterized membrane protein